MIIVKESNKLWVSELTVSALNASNPNATLYEMPTAISNWLNMAPETNKFKIWLDNGTVKIQKYTSTPLVSNNLNFQNEAVVLIENPLVLEEI